ncbi:MAG: D-glucuronyl C5-epimerase family protein [Candidatus Zixiibacteriota bacterium]
MHIFNLAKANIRVLFGRPDYWHPDIRANCNLQSGFNQSYYLDLSAKANYPGEIDQNGIPKVKLGGKLYYIPVAISHFGLGCYERYLRTKQKTYLKKFFDCLNWFEKNYETIDSACVWLNRYEKGLYSLKPPWVSAIVQGQIISVLCRGYSITGNNDYINLALKAARSFEIPASEGGVKTCIGDESYLFYEEYPSSTPSYVLNGFIFSLWGLYDLYLISKEKKVGELYQSGLKTLIRILPKYDFLSWSRYDLYNFKIPNISNIFYANLHIEQLKAMYMITKNKIFKKYANRWNKGKKNLFLLVFSQSLMALHKIYFLVFKTI